MSDIVNKSASITPPVAAKNTIVLAGSASSSRIKLPDDWRKSWITIYADGVKLYVALGGATVAVDETHVTTLTSEAPSAHGAGECIPIPDGGKEPFNLAEVTGTAPPSSTHPAGPLFLAWKAASATGYIRIVRSSGPVPQS